MNMMFILLVIIVIVIYIIYTSDIKITTDIDIPNTKSKAVTEIYDLLQNICCLFDQQNVEYIMTGGTLLGAIRHNGMIPWDDDGDICVLNKSPSEVLVMLDALKSKNIISKLHWKGNLVQVQFKDNSSIIDIFFMQKNGDIYKYKSPFHIQYENEWYRQDELYPLKSYEFGPLILKGPNNPIVYLKRTYGKKWNSVASKWNSSSIYNKNVDLFTFKSSLPDETFKILQCKR